MPQKEFCKSQLYAIGDSKKAYACSKNTPGAKLFCGAHLNEGHAFPCPYKYSEIFLDKSSNDTPRIAHKNSKGILEGRCEDFELEGSATKIRIRK